jgi:hypothetical protein
VHRYDLPDGRAVLVERSPDGDSWYLQLEDEPEREIVGWPRAGALAELLGHAVTHESWPAWVDDCAAEIERLLRPT